MIDALNKPKRYNWTQCPRDAKEGRWSKLYVSMRSDGTI
jgi:hypothetical protein